MPQTALLLSQAWKGSPANGISIEAIVARQKANEARESSKGGPGKAQGRVGGRVGGRGALNSSRFRLVKLAAEKPVQNDGQVSTSGVEARVDVAQQIHPKPDTRNLKPETLNPFCPSWSHLLSRRNARVADNCDSNQSEYGTATRGTKSQKHCSQSLQHLSYLRNIP